jgi:hypothetical protein
MKPKYSLWLAIGSTIVIWILTVMTDQRFRDAVLNCIGMWTFVIGQFVMWKLIDTTEPNEKAHPAPPAP